ncbi:MAG: Hpt domain-containing protein [Gemmatimonadaceae bacterium]|nr:Hpt domain-containing protein [Gemmatimonadaceae bacterium]
MNGSPELLEFYLVEATEYLDSLDHIVSGSGGAPDGNAFIATARALRGASSMAKVDAIAAIAASMELVAHSVRDGEMRWTLELHGVLQQTVDDLRFLVRGVRTWGERETARADARLAGLQRFLPSESARQVPPAAAATAPVFIALQSSAIAAELDAFVAKRHRRALDDALTRVRTMRGIAGIADFPPLADVADAVDRAARALMPDAPLSERDVELFRSAADVLREASARLRAGEASSGDSPAVGRFVRAAHALEVDRTPEVSAPVVPIDQLFYADRGPHVVQRAVAPPTSRLQRFREEILTRAEHVRRLVNDARHAQDAAGRSRAARTLYDALIDMQGTAASFEVHQVAGFFGEAARETDLLAPQLLEAIEAGTLLLLTPGEGVDEIERRLAVLERARRVTPILSPAQSADPPAAPPALPPVALQTPAAPAYDAPELSSPPAATAAPQHAAAAPAAAPPAADGSTPPAALAAEATPSAPWSPPAPARSLAPRRSAPTPTGRELQSLLQEGIAGFSVLEDEPLSAPARLDEDDIVPIESIVYRGQSAVQRAIAVRDEMRVSGRFDDENLQEIFDLLDLAQAE